MKIRFTCLALVSFVVLTPSSSFAEEMASISRPDIAAANCPAEWAALSALEPDHWATSNPIGIIPSLDPAMTDALNKYFVAIMASAEHISSIMGFSGQDTVTPSYFDEAIAKHDLSICLTLTPAERDLVVEASLIGRPKRTEERARAALFKGFDQYDCMGFAQASAEIFRLDPQSASFRTDYTEIMSALQSECDFKR